MRFTRGNKARNVSRNRCRCRDNPLLSVRYSGCSVPSCRLPSLRAFCAGRELCGTGKNREGTKVVNIVAFYVDCAEYLVPLRLRFILCLLKVLSVEFLEILVSLIQRLINDVATLAQIFSPFAVLKPIAAPACSPPTSFLPLRITYFSHTRASAKVCQTE